jgi:hypothetical protein
MHVGGRERRIVAAERRGILERWRYGRALLADPKLLTSTGEDVRPEVAEGLVRAAGDAGIVLTAHEIGRRLRCARAYVTEEELGLAASRHEGWSALAEAGFPREEPRPTPDAGHEPGGRRPVTASPGARWQQPALDGDDGSVFPRRIRLGGATLDRDACTLATLEDYLAGNERWTDAHARRNERQRAHLDELIRACGGDRDVVYAEAVARVGRPAPS